ncbi:head-tail joining protein [Escherichia coli]
MKSLSIHRRSQTLLQPITFTLYELLRRPPAGDEETIREWGRPVKLRGKADPIIAIFNEPYARVDVPHAGFITGTVTSLTALSDDVAGVVARDVVQVPKQRSIAADGSVTWSGWTDYVVKEPQPDGIGLTNIF